MIKSRVLDKLFDAIIEMPEERNLILRRGTIVEATIIQSARKTKKKEGKEDQKGDKDRVKKESSQQDKDAQFTRKGNKTYYGYKGHTGMDERSGIIRKASFTSANVHDSQEMEHLISGDEASVFAEKSYDSQDRKRQFRKHTG